MLMTRTNVDLLVEHLENKRLTEEGKTYVLETALALPARKVGRKQRNHNLILEVPIPPIGLVLQAESLTGEYAFLVRQQRRTDLVTMFDQPITVTVEIVDRGGRARRTTYTADYLVVEDHRVVAEEIMPDSELRELLLDRPEDYTFDGERYHYLPAERYFAQLGIYHQITPISELSQLVTANLQLLTSSRKAPELKGYAKVRKGVVELLEQVRTIRIGELLDRLEREDATPFLQLIDRGLAFVDLERVVLAPATIRDVWISSDPQLARIAQQSSQRLRELMLKSEQELDGGQLTDPRYHLEIATRIALLEGTTTKDHKGKIRTERTLRRYRAAFNAEDIRSIEPGWADCGPDLGSLLHTNHLALIEGTVREFRKDPKHPSTGQAFRAYEKRFKANRAHLDITDRKPIVRSTFYLYWARTPLEEGEAYNKGGRRLENASADSVNAFDKSLAPTRPFQVAHIDHWKADFHLVVAVANGKRYTKRPWLTCMVDSYSGEILAFWLSFRDPSRRACAMVIRDCVRRHGRLPEMIITDGGSEFKSVHFLVMLATLGVVRCERPPEDPRYGKEVERVFKQLKERFARGLPGFGISIEQARAVSGAFKAPRHATLSLLDAIEVLDCWIFQGYNTFPKPGTTTPRCDLVEQGFRAFPALGIPVAWDLRFLIATSIEAPGSHYSLWEHRGLHLLDKWYSSPKLLSYGGHKKDLVVRVEPFCDAVIYVRIDGKWLVCARQDVRLQLSMSDARLIATTSERHELSALRREIQNDADEAAAELVNDLLADIASRPEAEPGAAAAASPTTSENAPTAVDQTEEVEITGARLPFTFEQIDGLPEEVE